MCCTIDSVECCFSCGCCCALNVLNQLYFQSTEAFSQNWPFYFQKRFEVNKMKNEPKRKRERKKNGATGIETRHCCYLTKINNNGPTRKAPNNSKHSAMKYFDTCEQFANINVRRHTKNAL